MNICVYGASSTATGEQYLSAGEKLGKAMADKGYGLVFGGGANGMMGAVARGMTQGNGKIIGIAPSFFNVDGILYDKCTEFLYPDTMRERKRMMDEMSGAFIVTPGGIGTFDEFFEILTLKQLNRHNKPIVLMNTNGYFDSLLQAFEKGIEENFMHEYSRELMFVSDSPEEILEYIENYKAEEISVSKLKRIFKGN